MKVISIGTPHRSIHSAENTYVVCLAKKGDTDSHRDLELEHRRGRDKMEAQPRPFHIGDAGPFDVRAHTLAHTADLPERYGLLYLRQGANGTPNRFGYSGTPDGKLLLQKLPSCEDCHANLLAGTEEDEDDECDNCAAWDFSRLHFKVPAHFPLEEEMVGVDVESRTMVPLHVTGKGVLRTVALKAFDKIVAKAWNEKEATAYLTHTGGLTKGAVNHILEHADNELQFQEATGAEAKGDDDAAAATFQALKAADPQRFEPWLCPLWDRAHLFVDPMMHLCFHVRKKERERM